MRAQDRCVVPKTLLYRTFEEVCESVRVRAKTCHQLYRKSIGLRLLRARIAKGQELLPGHDQSASSEAQATVSRR